MGFSKALLITIDDRIGGNPNPTPGAITNVWESEGAATEHQCACPKSSVERKVVADGVGPLRFHLRVTTWR